VPIESTPVAQAVITAVQEPFALYFIAMLPAARFGIIIGMNNGDTFRMPPVSIFSTSVSNVVMPPIPVPKCVDSLSGSTVPSMPLSRIACPTATNAYWEYRSSLRASLRSM
jgi:hypothetical protein